MTILSNLQVGKKESVVDEILLLNPNSTPLLSMLGFAEAITNTEHVWYEDEMFATKTTATANKTATDTAIAVASVEPFRERQVIAIGDELLLVTAVDAGAKTITVQRGYAGTTAAAIVANADIDVMFVEGEEGADARAARSKPKTKVANVTQIFDDTVSISGSAASVALYGNGGKTTYETEKQKKQLELALQLENALINGRYFDNGVKRGMRGMRQSIQTNVIRAQNAQIADTMLVDLAQMVHAAGGFKTGGDYKFLVPAGQKLKISRFSSDKLRVDQASDADGRVVDYIVCDFGRFEVKMNDNLNAKEVIFFDANRAKVRPLADREFFHEYLGKKGDRYEGQVLGEYTFEFKQEKAHARIEGLA